MELQINMVAVLVAVVANFVLGFVWYTPLFGKAWAKEMGMDPNEKPPGGEMARNMILMVIGNFFLAFVFANNIAVWDLALPADTTMMSKLFSATFYTWLGFFLPVDLTGPTWERRSWKLFGINTSYHFVSLLVVAAILMNMQI